MLLLEDTTMGKQSIGSSSGGAGEGGNNTDGGSSNDSGSSDEALRRVAKLVSSLLARADCAPFREPVDWRGLEIWDYPKVIKKVRRNRMYSMSKVKALLLAV